METAIFKIEGMMCGHCEAAVAGAVKKLPGVKEAQADRLKKQAIVHYDPVQVSPQQIKKAIADTGYAVV